MVGPFLMLVNDSVGPLIYIAGRHSHIHVHPILDMHTKHVRGISTDDDSSCCPVPHHACSI
jgi:hypothetical protein